ncbi:MAG: transglutaminase domain-containing protein [Oscillospiraceae bacterium]
MGEEDTADILSYSGEIDESITRIADAYSQNNADALTDSKEIEIYNECDRIIKLLITEDMTEYEKELAIHNYIITHAQYDLDELSTFEAVSEDSFTPYGILFNKKGVCLGYTRTFQLFMDIIGVECLTVHSTANDNEEHAWNMVRLDGRWYHVDVTWDDPIPDNGEKPVFSYFNVTDEIMKAQHQWDSSKFPRADSTAYNYHVMSGLIAEDQRQLEQIVAKEINKGKELFSLIVNSSFKPSLKFTSDLGHRSSSYSISYGGGYSMMNIYVS